MPLRNEITELNKLGRHTVRFWGDLIRDVGPAPRHVAIGTPIQLRP